MRPLNDCHYISAHEDYKKSDYKSLFKEGVYSRLFFEDNENMPHYNFIKPEGTGFFISTEDEDGFLIYEFFNWKINHNVLILDNFKCQYVYDDGCLRETKSVQFFRFNDYNKGEFSIDMIQSFNSSGERFGIGYMEDIILYKMKRLGSVK